MKQQIREKLALLRGDNEQQLTAWLDGFELVDGQRATTNLRLIAEQLNEELAHFVQQIVTEEGIGGFRDYVNNSRSRQVSA